MKTILVLSAVFLAVFASTPKFINWKNVKQADFKPKGLIPSIEGRIFGGNVAQPHQFPYQAELYANNPDDNDGIMVRWCGGSLISKEFVLTAAHCLIGETIVNVTLGAQDIIQDYNDIVLVSTQTFFVHPDYNRTGRVNDIALVKLPSPVELSDSIQTIQLPPRSMLQTKLEGRMAVMTGWGGLTNDDEYSSDLRYANLRVLPQSTCAATYKHFYDSHICVSGGVQSICRGDYGGPLVAQEEDGTNVVIGVAAFTRREGCEQGFPTGFTRVTSYLDWISKITGIPIRN